MQEFKFEDAVTCSEAPLMSVIKRILPGQPHAVPWLYIGTSAALHSKGLHAKGVYPARPFPTGEEVGLYLGEVVCTAADADHDARINAIWNRGYAGDSVITLFTDSADKHDHIVVDGKKAPQSDEDQITVVGRVVFPSGGSTWPGMHAYAVNDARACPGFINTLTLSDEGVMSTTKALPAFDLTQGFDSEHNRFTELLFDYGDDFWEEKAQRDGILVQRMDAPLENEDAEMADA